MRAAFHVILGAAAGLAGGILAPIGMALLMYVLDRDGMQHGGGTPFAIMIIVTAPLGAIAGAIWGASRAFPTQEAVVRNSAFGAVDFEWRLTHVPEAERDVAVIRLLGVWIDGFNSEVRKHQILLAGALLLTVFSGWLGVILFLLPAAASALRFVVKSRSAMRDFRRRYGEAAVQQLGELPWLLR